MKIIHPHKKRGNGGDIALEILSAHQGQRTGRKAVRQPLSPSQHPGNELV
jgi:hypothetical protein